MKKKYRITGMSSGGCVYGFKQALLKVPDVTEVEVQLQPKTAVVTMNRSIDVIELQTQLKVAGHYRIKEAILN